MLGVEIVIDIRNTVECGLAQWRLRNVRCSGRTPLAVRLVGVQLALQAELCVGRRLIAVGFGQLLLQLLDALLQLTDFDLADCLKRNDINTNISYRFSTFLISLTLLSSASRAFCRSNSACCAAMFFSFVSTALSCSRCDPRSLPHSSTRSSFCDFSSL